MRESRIRYGVLNYTLPGRVMWLKQRIGRLVRSQTDKGWIVVFDPRFYGFGRASQELVRQALAPLQIKEFTCAQVLSEIEATRDAFLDEVKVAEKFTIE